MKPQSRTIKDIKTVIKMAAYDLTTINATIFIQQPTTDNIWIFVGDKEFYITYTNYSICVYKRTNEINGKCGWHLIKSYFYPDISDPGFDPVDWLKSLGSL